MSRASETLLEELHNTIATTLRDELKHYADGDYDIYSEPEDDSEPVLLQRKSIPASLIQSTCKYLKDNGIDTPEEPEEEDDDDLEDKLPKFGED